jgi:hypothetical protein
MPRRARATDIFYCAFGTVKAIPAETQPMTASPGGGNWPRRGQIFAERLLCRMVFMPDVFF